MRGLFSDRIHSGSVSISLLALFTILLFGILGCDLIHTRTITITEIDAPVELIKLDPDIRYDTQNRPTGQVDVICTLRNNGPAEKFKVVARITSPAFEKKSLIVHFAENATETVTFSFTDINKQDIQREGVVVECGPRPSD